MSLGESWIGYEAEQIYIDRSVADVIVAPNHYLSSEYSNVFSCFLKGGVGGRLAVVCVCNMYCARKVLEISGPLLLLWSGPCSQGYHD